MLATSLLLVTQPLTAQTATEQEQLDLAAKRGRQIFQYDQAGWHASDALLADVKRDMLDGVAGWVVTPDIRGLKAVFYKKAEGGPIGFYSAIWTGSELTDRKLLTPGTETVLDAQQLALIGAKDMAMETAFRDRLMLCSPPQFNPVVLPPDMPGEPITVYLLSPQTKSHAFPMGGHHRLQYRDGKEVSRRAFTKTCLTIGDGSEKDKKPEALVVSHLLDPVPTEIHVFTMYTSRLTIMVMTTSSDKMWVLSNKIGSPTIQAMKDSSTKKR